MVSKLQSFVIMLFVVALKAETFVYDGTVPAPSVIECTDASTPCFISCTAKWSCTEREIHCHRTVQQLCSIYVLERAGRDSFYFTHRAPIVNITGTGEYALFRSAIYAHEALKTKLYLEVDGTRGFEGGTVFAPVGQGSLLNINCNGGDACRSMRIYDDWTTEVRIVATGKYSRIRNIFDDSPLNISRNDTNYIGLNSAYRAPVFLSGFATQSFLQIQYFGHNHGDWTLYGAEDASFHLALIEATADIPPYNRSSGYNIRLIGTSTSGRAFSGITLNASQCGRGPNIYAESRSYAYGKGALTEATIYARNANSVEIQCKEGGHCNDLKVECAYNNCTVLCDDQTDCSNMKIYTCSRAAVICDGINCAFAGTKVFCGFNQNDTFYEPGSGEFLCRNYSYGDCINEHTAEGCEQETNQPTEIPTSDPLSDILIARDIDTTVDFNEAPVSIITTAAVYYLSDEPELKEDMKQNKRDIIIIAVSSSILLVCAIIYYAFVYRKRKRKERLKEVENMVKDENQNKVEMNAKKKAVNANATEVIQSTDAVVHGEDDEIFDDDDDDDAEGLYIVSGAEAVQKNGNVTKTTVGSTDSDSDNNDDDLYIARESVAKNENRTKVIAGCNNDDEYKLIKEMLKSCDGEQWQQYLDNFINEKVNDARLKFIESKTDPIWDKLIPEWGVKMEFISILMEKKKCVETMVQ